MKSKPLKSEKDRLHLQKEKSAIKKPVIVCCKDAKPVPVSVEKPKKEVIPELSDLKIAKTHTEIVKAEKTIELKPKPVKKSLEDEVMTQKTVDPPENLNIQ